MKLAERLAQKYFAKDSSNELLARAIANEALEEAAKVAESKSGSCLKCDTAYFTAIAIRELKSRP